MSSRFSTAVFDLDNTFYDWVAVFAATTTCLVESLGRQSGVDHELLEAEVRAAFSRAGSLEHTFLIQDLPSLRLLHPADSPMELLARYDATVEAVKSVRRQALSPYPGVVDGLRHLHKRGIGLAALTSAPRFAANQRLRVLGLVDLFDLVAAAPDSPIPDHTNISALRAHPESHYQSRTAELEVGAMRKPDPRLLQGVLAAVATPPEKGVMVGDDVRNDVGMAHRAGVDAIWAKYGVEHNPADREVLLRFTHWSASDAARHYELTPHDVGLNVVGCATTFDEIVDLILK